MIKKELITSEIDNPMSQLHKLDPFCPSTVDPVNNKRYICRSFLMLVNMFT